MLRVVIVFFMFSMKLVYSSDNESIKVFNRNIPISKDMYFVLDSDSGRSIIPSVKHAGTDKFFFDIEIDPHKNNKEYLSDYDEGVNCNGIRLRYSKLGAVLVDDEKMYFFLIEDGKNYLALSTENTDFAKKFVGGLFDDRASCFIEAVENYISNGKQTAF